MRSWWPVELFLFCVLGQSGLEQCWLWGQDSHSFPLMITSGLSQSTSQSHSRAHHRRVALGSAAPMLSTPIPKMFGKFARVLSSQWSVSQRLARIMGVPVQLPHRLSSSKCILLKPVVFPSSYQGGGCRGTLSDDGSGDRAVAEVLVDPGLEPRPCLFSKFCVREVVA